MEDAELRQGERILWEGRPVPLAYALPNHMIVIAAFVLLFPLTFAAFVLATPIPPDAPPFPLLPALIPPLFILLLVLPGTIGAWRDAPRVRYILTDRRAIVVGARRRAEVDLTTLGFVEVGPWSMGTSTVYFAPTWPGESVSFMWPTGGYTTPAFRAINEGERVYRMVLDARERLRRP
jgi:hypothetical protein